MTLHIVFDDHNVDATLAAAILQGATPFQTKIIPAGSQMDVTLLQKSIWVGCLPIPEAEKYGAVVFHKNPPCDRRQKVDSKKSGIVYIPMTTLVPSCDLAVTETYSFAVTQYLARRDGFEEVRAWVKTSFDMSNDHASEFMDIILSIGDFEKKTISATDIVKFFPTLVAVDQWMSGADVDLMKMFSGKERTPFSDIPGHQRYKHIWNQYLERYKTLVRKKDEDMFSYRNILVEFPVSRKERRRERVRKVATHINSLKGLDWFIMRRIYALSDRNWLNLSLDSGGFRASTNIKGKIKQLFEDVSATQIA